MIDKIKSITDSNTDSEERSLKSVFNATKQLLLSIPKDPNDPYGEPLFKAVQLDTGQFERIIGDTNMEYGIAFPACFIRFVNVRYLVEQNRTNEGRCTMRVRYILNNLINTDDEFETEPFEVFDMVNNYIQEAKDDYPALAERVNLQYWDMPQSSNMLQPYWLDFEVYFRADSGYQYKDYIKRKLVTPQFTNWSDVPDVEKPDVEYPTYNEQSGFQEKF